MNGRQYRTYTEEFRQEALELLRTSRKSVAQIELDLEITCVHCGTQLEGA